jgi:hypothetical protein
MFFLKRSDESVHLICMAHTALAVDDSITGYGCCQSFAFFRIEDIRRV